MSAKGAGRAARAARAAAEGAGPGERKPIDATQAIGIAVAVLGLLPVLVLALICLLALALIVGVGGLAAPADPSASNGPFVADVLLGGDPHSELSAENIPDPALVEPLREAGRQCTMISAVILAAQIMEESGFDPAKVGPNGETGISQLPPDVFDRLGEDDDDSGEASALDPVDSIFAQARYLCELGDAVQQLIDDGRAAGERLTLALLAYDIGLAEVERRGGMPVPDVSSYPYRVRVLFPRFMTGGPELPGKDVPPPGSSGKLDEAAFNQIFPGRIPFYTYAGLMTAMAKYPAFGQTGDETTRKREIAAFLANVNQESGGLRYVEEINRSAWGNYCNAQAPYGCPAGHTAYHGRGPIQLSWNTNYHAAGQALNLDLLNNPDLVMTNASVAWQTALWFWMTQSGAGTMTPHAAITNGSGFGETIRSINGILECHGGQPAAIANRVNSYREYTRILGVTPGDRLEC
ncbi:hypothetical protein J2S43_001937 [Catenuloplanes nepalensis]|uniref:Chitinase n=1 Tax=Catenuloplanes nepalensis TaxID=587533 RepID=A0ABT9MPT9_9ACTN|nr:glycoside hydrolase family 19 protein [Catenuloplanes nepalensis]MDP9793425.1 hypothetical protein [Catenuloplanes nepalensis]